MRGLIVVAAFVLGLALNTAPVASRTIVDSNANVSSFYGIPIDLTVRGSKRLPYRVKIRRWFSEEAGEHYSTAEIIAKDGVELDVSFDSKGRLYQISTRSPGAVGRKGIRIGSPLSEVRAAWPNGKLSYGSSTHGTFVSFSTGTNVTYSFDYKDMPPELIYQNRKDIEVPDIRVRGIHIYPRTVPVPDPCRPGYCS